MIQVWLQSYTPELGRSIPLFQGSVFFLGRTVYIIIGNSLKEQAIAATKTILEQLGFTIHPQKSVLKPTREIAYLGFIIYSMDMIISLPPDKGCAYHHFFV